MRKKTIAIINQRSGMFHLIQTLAEVETFLQSKIPRVKIYRTKSEQAAKMILRRCRADGTKLVILVGGDGTIHTAVQVLAGSAVAIGIVPFGTANNIAISLGITSFYKKAIDLISSASPTVLDLGKIGRTYFVEAAGMGFHAEALAFYTRQREKSFVRSVYAFTRILLELAPFRVWLEIDGEKIEREIYQVTFSNLPLYGTGFSLAPDAICNDGLIDVTVVGGIEKDQMLQYLLSAKMGTLSQLPQVEIFRCRCVRIKTEKPMHLHLDAELRFGNSFVVRAAPAVLRAIMPEKQF